MNVGELISKLSAYDADMPVGYLDHNGFDTFETYSEADIREETVYDSSILEDGSTGSVVGVNQEVVVLW